MASLFDAVERPRVIINTNDFDKPKSLADAIEREPEAVDGIPEHHKNILQSTVDKLFGLHGEERYQLWPERLVRDAVSAPHDVMTGQIPTHEVDPVTGEVHTSSGMIKAAQDVSALAGTGGLAGAGNEAGMALGSGPILKSTIPEIKPFYSAVENAVAAAKQPKADIQQWLSFLKNQPGVKQEELAHLGLDKLSGAITKDDLLKAVQEGQPQINEVIKGGDAGTKEKAFELAKEHGWKSWEDIDPSTQAKYMQRASREAGENPTKYHSYQLPGGENYREMLLTLPVQGGTNKRVRIYNSDGLSSIKVATPEELERLRSTGRIKFDELEDVNPQTSYTSSHWVEPNVLAHIRMNDRMIDGKKSLHLEEIQSDWHQEGRKKGYKGESKNSRNLDDIQKDLAKAHEDLVNNPNAETKASYDKFMEERRLALGEGLVPDAPFKKTWDELALKKAITHAVKNGYDSISWTPGEAQAARYDLSKQVDSIKYLKNEDGTYNIVPFKNNSPVHSVEGENIKPEKLADIVGKEVAEKIVKGDGNREAGTSDIRVLSGQDLKVGGQGMKAFYDKMLVDKMNALTKKHGGKVEKGELPSGKRKTLDEISNDLGFGGWHSNLTETQKSKIMSVFYEQKPQREGKTEVHILKITPELREHVLKKGFPLFSAGVPVFSPVDNDPFKKDK